MIVVVYRRKLNAKPEMAIFETASVDDVLNSKKRKPLIPNNWTIEEVGVGESLISYYENKLKITKKSFNPVF